MKHIEIKIQCGWKSTTPDRGRQRNVTLSIFQAAWPQQGQMQHMGLGQNETAALKQFWQEGCCRAWCTGSSPRAFLQGQYGQGLASLCIPWLQARERSRDRKGRGAHTLAPPSPNDVVSPCFASWPRNGTVPAASVLASSQHIHTAGAAGVAKLVGSESPRDSRQLGKTQITAKLSSLWAWPEESITHLPTS